MTKKENNSFSELIKRERLKKKLTQAELAELTKISLRSIQRLEKGEVTPRAHTLKSISKVLGIKLSNSSDEIKKGHTFLSATIILSLGSLIICLLLAIAYLSQASNFPETDFEFQIYWTVVILLIGGIQWYIWISRRVKPN